MDLFLDVDDYTGSLQFLVRGQMGQNLKAKKRGDCSVSDPDSLNSDPDLDIDPGGSRFTQFVSRSRHFAEFSHAWIHIQT